MKLLNHFRHSLHDHKTLEDRFFAVVLTVGLGIVSVSTVVTIMEKISPLANIGTGLGGIMLLVDMYVAYGLKKVDVARIMLCYTFNCIVIPITFFTCGGIDSGMPLYMLAGSFTLVPVLKGWHRITGIIVAFAVDIACIVFSYFLTPEAMGDKVLIPDLLARLSLESRFIDAISSLILIGLYIILTIAIIMDAYQKERTSREALLVKLDDLSKRDELTGLYNRRELFRFLEELTISDAANYLCMIDIDHFKNVNDSYGHVFGDLVLRKLAEIMKEEISKDGSELVARYGGEEFLLVVRADDQAKALERIDRIRQRFVGTKWELDDQLVTSFSGGIVHCRECGSYAEAISQADKLLYKAKENGRNRLEA